MRLRPIFAKSIKDTHKPFGGIVGDAHVLSWKCMA
ncbi:uncharacterized protein METZ01_LOCUS225973 [marine metagenome]|uniref:Uncharacterized protein n=1 Tax=marine metagenome TaxID=408172 RepID=A0A382GDW7_9ZZZZ